MNRIDAVLFPDNFLAECIAGLVSESLFDYSFLLLFHLYNISFFYLNISIFIIFFLNRGSLCMFIVSSTISHFLFIDLHIFKQPRFPSGSQLSSNLESSVFFPIATTFEGVHIMIKSIVF